MSSQPLWLFHYFMSLFPRNSPTLHRYPLKKHNPGKSSFITKKLACHMVPDKTETRWNVRRRKVKEIAFETGRRRNWSNGISDPHIFIPSSPCLNKFLDFSISTNITSLSLLWAALFALKLPPTFSLRVFFIHVSCEFNRIRVQLYAASLCHSTFIRKNRMHHHPSSLTTLFHGSKS